MANYRNISISFWTDSKVDDDFTPEDKYFYLYLLTNPHTNICGCYEVSTKQMERETGYNIDTIKRLIARMQDIHDVIRYSETTKEMLILHWGRYNWSYSEKVRKAVISVASHIKNKNFAKYVTDTVNNKISDKQLSDKTDYQITDYQTTDDTDYQITDDTDKQVTDKTDTISVTDVSIDYAYPIDTISENTNIKSERPKRERFTPPTVEEVKAYCQETGKLIDAEAFVNYYTSNGWKVGRNPMKNWKTTVANWRKRDEESGRIYKEPVIDHSLDEIFPT